MISHFRPVSNPFLGAFKIIEKVPGLKQPVPILVEPIELDHVSELPPILLPGVAIGPMLEANPGRCRDAVFPDQGMTQAFNGTVWAVLDGIPSKEALPHKLREVWNPSRYGGGLSVQGN